MWFLSASQLICFDGKGWSTFPLPRGETPWAIFTDGLTVLPNGMIAIVTASPHILVFDPVAKRFSVIKHPGAIVTRMFVKQRDGSILVETSPLGSKDVSVEQFDGRNFFPFIPRDKLAGITDLRSILVAPDKKVWIGATGSFGVFDGVRYRKIATAAGFTDSGAYYIFRDPVHGMFAGGRDGLFHLENGRWRLVRRGLDRVRSMLTTRDGTMWVASGSGVYRYRNGVWIPNGG